MVLLHCFAHEDRGARMGLLSWFSIANDINKHQRYNSDLILRALHTWTNSYGARVGNCKGSDGHGEYAKRDKEPVD